MNAIDAADKLLLISDRLYEQYHCCLLELSAINTPPAHPSWSFRLTCADIGLLVVHFNKSFEHGILLFEELVEMEVILRLGKQKAYELLKTRRTDAPNPHHPKEAEGNTPSGTSCDPNSPQRDPGVPLYTME